MYLYTHTAHIHVLYPRIHTHACTQINAHTYSHHKILSSKSIYQLGSLKEKKNSLDFKVIFLVQHDLKQ